MVLRGIIEVGDYIIVPDSITTLYDINGDPQFSLETVTYVAPKIYCKLVKEYSNA